MSQGIIYYSKQCRNSIQLLQAMKRHPQKDDIYYIPVDRRRTMADGAVYVMMDDGKEVLLPPHIKQVPAYVSFAHGGRVFLGNDIATILFSRGSALPPAPTASIASGGGAGRGGGGGAGGAVGGGAGWQITGMGGGISQHAGMSDMRRGFQQGYSINNGPTPIGFSPAPGTAAPFIQRTPRPPMPPAEPSAFSFGDQSSISDNFSFVGLTPDDLSAKGNGGLSQLHGMTPLNAAFMGGIQTPPDDYVPNKMSEGDKTIEQLREERERDIPRHYPPAGAAFPPPISATTPAPGMQMATSMTYNPNIYSTL